MKESPIFARTHDLLLWLLPHTMGFPRSQRFVLTRRVQDAVVAPPSDVDPAGTLPSGQDRAAP